MFSNDTSGNIGGTGVLGSVSNFSGGDPQSGLNPWDTSDPFISHTTRILMQRVLKCYVRQAIVFVGIPGNLLCCLVFFKQGLSDKINLLLFWLAVVDLSSLLSQLLLMPRCYLTDKVQVSNWAVIDNIKTVYVGWWLGHLSGILIVVVSVHRCLSVALPLKAKRLLGYRPTMAIIVLSFMMSLMVFLPSLLAYTVRWTTDPLTNRSVAYSNQTTWFPMDRTQADDIIYNFFVVALPVFLSIMIVCCTITIVHLRQASRQRLKMTGTVTEDARAGQNRITVMLLVICGVYTFLVLPELIFSIVVMLVPGLNPWDTSDPFISHTTRILMQRVLKCYVRQAIVFVGIPGNLLCCLVFFKQGLSDKINLLLFWLAVADLSSLLSQLLLMPRCYLTDKIQVSNWAVIDNIKTVCVSLWLGNLSGILIVVVSVHRCLSVALPLKAKRLLGYRPTMAAIVMSSLMSFMVFLPSLLAHTVRWTTDPSTNRSVAYSVQTTWFPMDRTQAYNIIYNFLVVALPVFLSIMIVCCTITIVHLRQASRQRLKMTGTVTEDARAGQNRITVMLLVICGVYTFLILPQLIFSIIVMLVPGFYVFHTYHNTVIVTYQFTWIGTCLNSAINFFVYFVLSSRFKATLKNCFVALCTKRHTQDK
ncbi:hypothetical protein ACOMHN_010464 [Nucella lapillus]